ncbi:carbohydrate kinase family protein [Microbacterium sp.]|uniref:carbohydrate kinase family protein n=1 Tax=Microbacterium sp. TaxID=51671 RepID=UPI003A90C88B
MNSPRVFVAGPATWNSIVVLDRLPDPVPHMQFAEETWETIGGTSAGKALSLAAAGVDAVLYALVGDDEAGHWIQDALAAAGVPVLWGESTQTERHLNLMTRGGERVSLYLASPSEQSGGVPEDVRAAIKGSEVVVLDLAAEPRRLLPVAAELGRRVWVDVHDYDGANEFHRPFLDAADAVFCNADKLSDPLAFLRSRVKAGTSFAVCTLGAEGAVAVDAAGEIFRVPAVPVDVVDTNGAGDGFFAGVLAATLDGALLPHALAAGAASASAVLRSRHLHPLLDPVLRQA